MRVRMSAVSINQLRCFLYILFLRGALTIQQAPLCLILHLPSKCPSP